MPTTQSQSPTNRQELVRACNHLADAGMHLDQVATHLQAAGLELGAVADLQQIMDRLTVQLVEIAQR